MTVTLSWGGVEGKHSIGQCSFSDDAEFDDSATYEELYDRALEELESRALEEELIEPDMPQL